MKLKKIINEHFQPKVKMKVPTKVMNLLNAAIALEKDPTRKKTLKELKGIFIGKYPHPDALLNSLRGLRKKMSSLTEAKLKRSQKIGVGLLAALMTITTLIMPTVKTAATKTVVAPPEKKVEAPISDVEARVLSIGVKQEVWDKIYNELQDYLKKLISAEYQGAEAQIQLANILNKYNIGFGTKSPMSSGEYDVETGRISLNWNTLIRVAKKDITLEKMFGTIRHEMAHRAQFEMLKKLLSEEKFRKFLQTEMARSYVNRIIEVGAFHDELKRRVNSMKPEQLTTFLNKYSQSIIKNITLLYPETDLVVRAIYRAQPNLKYLITKLSKDTEMKQMRVAKDMVDKYQVVQDMFENPSKYFGEEIMEWKERVKNYLV